MRDVRHGEDGRPGDRAQRDQDGMRCSSTRNTRHLCAAKGPPRLLPKVKTADSVVLTEGTSYKREVDVLSREEDKNGPSLLSDVCFTFVILPLILWYEELALLGYSCNSLFGG